ncbi:MAG: NTP transferase domain-containing protein [Deltaproteobacteria bacterium]|nr:NTP transferase domain-containing protein [Deltaproteobacteria bacterium]
MMRELERINRDGIIADAAAIILSGGKSSRMGQPKALLIFDGEPLILHIVRKLQSLFTDVVVVAAPGEQFVELSSLLCSQPDQPNELSELKKPNKPKVKLVRDEVAHQGPVGGIYYGLRAAGREVAFVTSCDVPFLNLALIFYLTSQISNHDVVVPHWQGRFQPLHAVYRRTVAPLLKEQLERGELRPIYLYGKVRTCEIPEEEIRRFDPEGLSFLNMNSPEDYEAALTRWEEKRLQGLGPDSQLSAFSSKPSREGSVSCTVELFGVARLLAKTTEVSLSLAHGATLSDVYSALAERLPILVGRVITPDAGNLSSGYACNVNGIDFVRNSNVKVNPGDRIFIISADAGG